MAKRERHERVTTTLSLDPETNRRLRAYVRQKHTTISGAITAWIWDQKVKEEPAPADAAKAGE